MRDLLSLEGIHTLSQALAPLNLPAEFLDRVIAILIERIRNALLYNGQSAQRPVLVQAWVRILPEYTPHAWGLYLTERSLDDPSGSEELSAIFIELYLYQEGMMGGTD
jgi:hypothetical protein